MTKDGFLVVTAAAGILVLLVLVAHFRNPFRVVLTFTPLLIGTIWIIGLMGLRGVAINVTNVGVIPMILGIGVDYAVYVAHAYFRISGEDALAAMRMTGKAIFLCMLTTLIGFGSLAQSIHPVLRSMGELAVIGVVICFLTTVTVLPSLLILRGRILARPSPRSDSSK